MAERRTKSYSEKLLDPRWQKKRLEILQFAGWECENCGSKDKTLHVHHSYYEKGLEPWEYPDISMSALCEMCHAVAQSDMQTLHRVIGEARTGDCYPLEIAGYIHGKVMLRDPDWEVNCDDYNYATGVGITFNLTPEAIYELVDAEKNITGRRILVAIAYGSMTENSTSSYWLRKIALREVERNIAAMTSDENWDDPFKDDEPTNQQPAEA